MEKDLLCIPLAILCFIGSFLLLPYAETYQGATGYIYQNGWLYNIGHVVLVVVGIMLLTIPTVHRVRNLEDR